MNEMTSDHWTDRLSEYLDGDLPAEDRERLELHLLECPACAELLLELRQVVAAAGSLEDRDPARDLWPGIAGRLAPRAALAESPDTRPASGAATTPAEPISLEAHRRGTGVRRVALTVPQLLAAGIALVLFSAGGAWLALSPGAGSGPGAVASTVPAERTAPAGSEAPVAFATAYESAIADLEVEFREQRNRLDPETIRVVERNLAIIDAAIADAQLALEEDPASGFLNGHLANAMRRKVDLLRQAAQIGRTES